MRVSPLRISRLGLIGAFVVGAAELAANGFRAAAQDWSWQDALIQSQPDGSHRVRLRGRSTPTNSSDIPFRVILASAWPPAVVPLFEVERDGHYELWRRPLAGRENVTEALFFALPPLEEPDASRLTGRWQIQSTNQDGGRHWTFFELTAAGDRVVGRFDQNTDYRFGFITGGAWRSNLLTLNAEYIQDRYQLEAVWRHGKLIGTWRKHEAPDHGWWTGTQRALDPPLPEGAPTTPLWEWRSAAHKARRYSLGAEPPKDWAGWERSPIPLCRVWLP